jgi:hypothetical protein
MWFHATLAAAAMTLAVTPACAAKITVSQSSGACTGGERDSPGKPDQPGGGSQRQDMEPRRGVQAASIDATVEWR